jgi:hypothetical protein
LSYNKARTIFKKIYKIYKVGKLADLRFLFKAIKPYINISIYIKDSNFSRNGGSNNVLNLEDIRVSNPKDNPII